MDRAMYKPRPRLVRFVFAVCQNRSNTAGISAAAIPAPVSVTANRTSPRDESTRGPDTAVDALRRWHLPGELRTPPGMHCQPAFTRREQRACRGVGQARERGAHLDSSETSRSNDDTSSRHRARVAGREAGLASRVRPRIGACTSLAKGAHRRRGVGLHCDASNVAQCPQESHAMDRRHEPDRGSRPRWHFGARGVADRFLQSAR
jgi:hypothetical protein